MIHQRFKDSIDMYVKHKRHTGGFLKAILENNLIEAVGRADEEGKANLCDIVLYLYNNVPSNCWGSKEVVSGYLKS